MKWIVGIETSYAGGRKNIHVDVAADQPNEIEAVREVAEGIANQGVSHEIVGSRAWAFELGKPTCIVSVDYALEITTREPRE